MKVKSESEVTQSYLTLSDPMDYQAPPSMGFSRQEYWSGVPLPSPSFSAAKLLRSCQTPCDPIDGSPPGSPVPGILQERTLEWVAISFSSAVKSESEVTQLCPTLSNPMDCSLPGSSAHGIFQARVLEWGAIAFSSDSITSYNIFYNSFSI